MKGKSRFKTAVLAQNTVSANECTGALQKISLDPEEIRRFHDEYIGE